MPNDCMYAGSVVEKDMIAYENQHWNGNILERARCCGSVFIRCLIVFPVAGLVKCLYPRCFVPPIPAASGEDTDPEERHQSELADLNRMHTNRYRAQEERHGIFAANKEREITELKDKIEDLETQLAGIAAGHEEERSALIRQRDDARRELRRLEQGQGPSSAGSGIGLGLRRRR